MFQRTYGINLYPETGKFINFVAKAADFEKDVAVVQFGGAKSRPLEDCDYPLVAVEYRDKCFLFDRSSFANVEREAQGVRLAAITLYPLGHNQYADRGFYESSYNPHKSKITYNYESIEEYDAVVEWLKQGMQTLFCSCISKWSGGLKFNGQGAILLTQINVPELPPHMRPKQPENNPVSLRELMEGNVSNAKELDLRNLYFIRDAYNSPFQTPHIKAHQEKVVQKYGKLEEIEHIIAQKEKELLHDAEVWLEQKTNRREEQKILEFLNKAVTQSKTLSFEQLIAPLLELQPIAFDDAHKTMLQESMHSMLCNPDFLFLLRGVYERDFKNAFTTFEELLVQLTLLLQEEWENARDAQKENAKYKEFRKILKDQRIKKAMQQKKSWWELFRNSKES